MIFEVQNTADSLQFPIVEILFIQKELIGSPTSINTVYSERVDRLTYVDITPNIFKTKHK